MKYTTDFNSFLNESAKSDKLAPLFVKAIEKVDESLSYVDLAMAVAKILKEEYGDHNIKPFMVELQKQLSIKESIDEMAKSDVHYKEIMAMYNSGSFAKKKVGAAVCKNPNATLKQIEDVLGDAGYEDMLEFIEALGIKESFITEKEFSDEERKKLADKGFALPDGSFPIENVEDLKNAIHAYGRAANQSDAAKHIVKRAKDLGHEDLIPDSEDFQKSLKEAKDSDTFVGNPGEDKRMVDIRAFRGSVKDLTDFIDDKVEKSSK